MEERRRLPDAELEVMQAVWGHTPPVSRSDIQRTLEGRRPMAMTTLLTLLTRLADRGFLAVTRTGRSNCYTPLLSRQEYLADQSRRFLRTVCGGSVPAFAAALCDSGLTAEELAELRRLLEEGSL